MRNLENAYDTRQLLRIVKGHTLYEKDVSVLLTIDRLPENRAVLTRKALATEIGVSLDTLRSKLDRLTNARLIEVRMSPTNRIVGLKLTLEGQELLDHLRSGETPLPNHHAKRRPKVRLPRTGRVVTAKLPEELVAEMDKVSDRIARSKSWIVRQAIALWLADEQRKYERSIDSLSAVDKGGTESRAE